MSEQFLYVETYRPRKIEDCILPQRIINDLKSIVKQDKIPNLLFEGPAGTGKTTAARVLCETVNVDYLIINSSEERGIDILRTKVIDFASTMSLYGKGKKCIIMDEADYLTPEAQAAFRGVIEKFSSHCTFILTCNFASRLMEAISSRMATISFQFEKKEAVSLKTKMMKRIQKILSIEGVDFEDKAIVKLVEKYYPDFRKTIGEVQRMAMSGNVMADRLVGFNEPLERLFEHLKKKDFNGVRDWISNNPDIDSTLVFRKIYDGLYQYIKPQFIPIAVVLIGKYQYQHSMVVDPEINLAAFLVELMVEVEFQ